MVNFMQEQLIVVVVTMFSLLSAWSWYAVLQGFITEYYGSSLKIQLFSAIIVTIMSFLLLFWILRIFNFDKVSNTIDNVNNKISIKNDSGIEQI